MTKNVSTEGLRGLSLEIANNINSLNNSIDTFKDYNIKIRNDCKRLSEYNGSKVSGSSRFEKVNNKQGDYQHTLEKYEVWQIEGQEEVESNCNNLEKGLEDIENSISSLKLETSDMDLIADTIDGYIKSVEAELGENIDTSTLASAFGVLSSSIAFNSYNASTNNFVDTKQILSDYWTDGTLHFEKNADGTYTIYQNENGNRVAMGYTTALTAALYMKNLKDKVNTVPTSEPTKNTGETINESKTKYVTSNEVSNNVKEEIKQYANADILEKGNKDAIYNNMSNEAKDIIDGKTVILNPDKDLTTIIDKEMDIVIPENSSAKINGSTIIGGGGTTFVYDSNAGAYRLEGVENGGVEYTKQEMLSLEITKTRG